MERSEFINAQLAQNFFNGVLMAPQDYRRFREVLELEVRPGEPAGYAVVAGATPGLWARYERGDADYKTRITAFPSPRQRILLALTLQLGCCQSRFVFDLEAPQTRQMLAATKSVGALRLQFALPGQMTGFVFDFKVPDESVDALLTLPVGRSVPGSRLDYMEDIAFVTAYLLSDRDALAIDGAPEPEEVSVTEVISCLRHDDTPAYYALH